MLLVSKMWMEICFEGYDSKQLQRNLEETPMIADGIWNFMHKEERERGDEHSLSPPSSCHVCLCVCVRVCLCVCVCLFACIHTYMYIYIYIYIYICVCIGCGVVTSGGCCIY